MVQVQAVNNEESKKDSVDMILDNLRNSNTFQCDASYMTIVGSVKGTFTISPYFLIFDPKPFPDNYPLISVLLLPMIVAFYDITLSMLYRDQ